MPDAPETTLANGADAPPWKRPLFLGAAIFFVTLLFYLPAFDAGFVWDDNHFLTLNPLIQADDGLRRFWFTTEAEDYFPLTSTMLWFEWRLWGDRPAGYHATNLALHALCAVLVWRVLKRLKVPGAWLAGLIFGVHPVTVESAAWITERKNTLSMALYLLSLLLYLKFDEQTSGASAPCEGEKARRCESKNVASAAKDNLPLSQSPNIRVSVSPRLRVSASYFLSIVLFILALLSKTSVVVLPAILLLCAWWRRGRLTQKDLQRALPFLVLAIALGLVEVWFHAHKVLPDLGVVARPEGLFSRLAAAGCAVWFYLYKALLPVNLAMIYPRWNVDPRAVVAWLPDIALLAFLALAWRGRKSWGRPALFAAGYYIAALFPVLGFTDISYMRYSLVADHWQYLALPGVIAVAVAAGIRLRDRLHISPTAAVRAAAAVVIALGVLTWRQCGFYENEVTLWTHSISVNPGSWAAHSKLADALLAKDVTKAIEHYEIAIRQEPDAPEPHFNLALVFSAFGDGFLKNRNRTEAISYYESAAAQYREVLRIRESFRDAAERLDDTRRRLKDLGN